MIVYICDIHYYTSCTYVAGLRPFHGWHNKMCCKLPKTHHNKRWTTNWPFSLFFISSISRFWRAMSPSSFAILPDDIDRPRSSFSCNSIRHFAISRFPVWLQCINDNIKYYYTSIFLTIKSWVLSNITLMLYKHYIYILYVCLQQCVNLQRTFSHTQQSETTKFKVHHFLMCWCQASVDITIPCSDSYTTVRSSMKVS